MPVWAAEQPEFVAACSQQARQVVLEQAAPVLSLEGLPLRQAVGPGQGEASPPRRGVRPVFLRQAEVAEPRSAALVSAQEQQWAGAPAQVVRALPAAALPLRVSPPLEAQAEPQQSAVREVSPAARLARCPPVALFGPEERADVAAPAHAASAASIRLRAWRSWKDQFSA